MHTVPGSLFPFTLRAPTEEPIFFQRNSTYLPVNDVARGKSSRAFRLSPSLATDCAISPGGVGISVLGGEFGGRWEQSRFTTGPRTVIEKLSESLFHNPLGFSARGAFGGSVVTVNSGDTSFTVTRSTSVIRESRHRGHEEESGPVQIASAWKCGSFR
jgi:hypothetical protein